MPPIDWDARSAVEELRDKVKEVEGAQKGHEDVCSVRYGAIDTRLAAGSIRMDSIEKTIADGFRELRVLLIKVAGWAIGTLFAVLLAVLAWVFTTQLTWKGDAAQPSPYPVSQPPIVGGKK